jgi:ABC-type antimicrobial peptide transport system permease subunit
MRSVTRGRDEPTNPSTASGVSSQRAGAASSAIELIPTFGLRSYVMAGAIVVGALVIAAWLPSARAARTDPASALLAE